MDISFLFSWLERKGLKLLESSKSMKHNFKKDFMNLMILVAIFGPFLSYVLLLLTTRYRRKLTVSVENDIKSSNMFQIDLEELIIMNEAGNKAQKRRKTKTRRCTKYLSK